MSDQGPRCETDREYPLFPAFVAADMISPQFVVVRVLVLVLVLMPMLMLSEAIERGDEQPVMSF
jgi:hypothetical protein